MGLSEDSCIFVGGVVSKVFKAAFLDGGVVTKSFSALLFEGVAT